MAKNMSTITNTIGFGVFAMACCALSVGDAAAQATANPPSRASIPAAGAASQSADAAKSAQILASGQWKQVEQEFFKWLAVQVLYTPAQVAKMKSQLAAEVKNMSPAELQQFLDQWDAKLKVLRGNDAREARDWLGQYLSVVAEGRRTQLLQDLGITDVADLSASQIEDVIVRIRARRLRLQQQRAFFDIGRQQHQQMAQQFRADQRTVLQESGVGRAAQFGTNQTPLAPRQFDYRPPAQPIPFFW